MKTTRQRAWRRTRCALALLVGFGLLFLFLSLRMPLADSHSASARALADEDANPVITIDLTQTRGKIDAKAFGVIMANKGHDALELSHFYRTSEGQQQLVNLGARTLFYWLDRDDWANPYDSITAVPLSYPSVMYTDEFLQLNNAIGSDAMISVNITNLCRQSDANLPPSSENVDCEMATAAHAKAWLAYIKSTGIREVKYVQLGAEPYAGCKYWSDPKGVNCTTARGEHKIVLTQDEYAKRANAWAKALRKVDPKIKIGVHLLPNASICKTSCNGVSWDEKVLKTVGAKIDFVITHQYFAVMPPIADEATAQKYSYLEEQIDWRKRNEGVTAMPIQVRKELLKWLPSKKNVPIVFGEYNAARTEADDQEFSVNTRMSLFAGMSVAQGYLISVSPVKLKGVTYPGASKVILLDIHSVPVMLAHYFPLNTPTTLVYSPAWHMLAALKDFQGRTWVTTKIKNNPNTPVGRGALRVYAVKKGKSIWVAVFNHSADTALTANVKFVGATLVGGNATRVGDTAASFLTQNTLDNPTAIGLTTTPIPAAQIKKSTLSGMVFPAHSLTVIQLKRK